MSPMQTAESRFLHIMAAALPVLYAWGAQFIAFYVSPLYVYAVGALVVLAGLVLFAFLRLRWGVMPLGESLLNGWTFLPVYPVVGLCMYVVGYAWASGDRDFTVAITLTFWPAACIGTFVMGILNMHYGPKPHRHT